MRLSAFLRVGVAATASLLAGRAAAQTGAMALTGTNPAATAYTGPRYPGGPDSLRAVLARRIRQAGIAGRGQVFLPLLAKPGDRSSRHHLLEPPADTPDDALADSKQVQALARRLRDELPALEPATAPLPNGQPVTALLVPLTFGAVAALPLAYSDEEPTFTAQTVPGGDGQPVPAPNLMYFLQRQIRYPTQALRRGEEGKVYAYFEITETGAVEQARVINSAGPVLDAEVMRVMQLIPPALTPPRQQGRPVRVYYVQPFTFKIQ